MKIDINEQDIKVQGESFYLELIWKKIFKVEEEVHHFLIYQNNLSAIIISKKDLQGQDIEALKQIFKLIPSVPIHVKR